MKKKIAVEPDLKPVKELLSKKGYEVHDIDYSVEFSNEVNNFDGLVVTGLNSNYLGAHNTNTKSTVVDAAGMSAEQIYHELQQKLD